MFHDVDLIRLRVADEVHDKQKTARRAQPDKMADLSPRSWPRRNRKTQSNLTLASPLRAASFQDDSSPSSFFQTRPSKSSDDAEDDRSFSPPLETPLLLERFSRRQGGRGVLSRWCRYPAHSIVQQAAAVLFLAMIVWLPLVSYYGRSTLYSLSGVVVGLLRLSESNESLSLLLVAVCSPLQQLVWFLEDKTVSFDENEIRAQTRRRSTRAQQRMFVAKLLWYLSALRLASQTLLPFVNAERKLGFLLSAPQSSEGFASYIQPALFYYVLESQYHLMSFFRFVMMMITRSQIFDGNSAFDSAITLRSVVRAHQRSQSLKCFSRLAFHLFSSQSVAPRRVCLALSAAMEWSSLQPWLIGRLVAGSPVRSVSGLLQTLYSLVDLVCLIWLLWLR